MIIRIEKSSSGMSTPYGTLSKENKELILDNIGQYFEAERVNMNYYQLQNGMFVHIYNAREIKPKVLTY